MSGRIVVHIGTHKTGTTSLQKGLAANRSLLKRGRVLYPDYGIAGLGSHYAHIDMANGLASRHPKFSRENAESFFSMVRSASKNYDTTIISAESFFRQVINKKLPQMITSPEEYWESRCKYIKLLRNAIGPAEICLVVRRQDDFAESMYQEQIKVTRYAKDFRSFCQDFWFHFEYFSQVNAWKEHFDKVTIVPFEKISGPRLVNSFLSEINVEPLCANEHKAHNVSIPHDGVIIKRLGNSLSLNKQQLNQLAYALGGDHFRSSVYQVPRSFFKSKNDRSKFLGSYNSSNREVARLGGFDESYLCSSGGISEFVYGDSLYPAEKLRLLRSLEGSLPTGILAKFPGFSSVNRSIGSNLLSVLKFVRNKI
ncbi:hypothetical protein [Paracoccus marcusii]|uniref:hypothetical protein n=1 Tax=Paracoccus marcusii TaxID=59779 RepID=UPI00249048F2|nr:hypothetical protein [Paracoccus marcusii]